MPTLEEYREEVFELKREKAHLESRLELYETSLQELSNVLSIKHVLVDLHLSQTTIEGIRQSLEALVETHGTL